jgi:hypothetical protein
MNTSYNFVKFLKEIWKDNTPEEAVKLWKWRIHNYPQAAKAFLEAIEQTLAAPPDNFIEVVQDNGWIFLTHDDKEGNSTPFSLQEYLEWFQKMEEQFKAIYEEILSSQK